MRRAAVVIGVLLIVMAPALLTPTARSLQVRTDAGALIWCEAVSRNDVVQLQFTHSMFGGYVREQWRVTPNNRLDRMRFVTENAAAAEYYATDGSSYRADDGYVVPGERMVRTSLVVRVNQRGNHQLTVAGEAVDLASLLPQSARVHISVVSETCDNPT